jgi:Protein of unknown function (DUF2958)
MVCGLGLRSFDSEDTFFGAVSGFEFELGYFSLSELEQTTGPLGLHIERDLYFKPTPQTRYARPTLMNRRGASK